MNDIVLIVIAMFSTIGCTEWQNSKEKYTGALEIVFDTTVTVTCDSGNYFLKVNTRFLPSRFDTVFVLRQEVFIVSGNKQQPPIKFPFSNLVVVKGQEAHTIQETYITQVKCILSSKGTTAFYFYGISAFDPKHEFFGIYLPQGEWACYYLGNAHEVLEQYGQFELYDKEFGKEVLSLDGMTPVCSSFMH